MKYFGRKSLSSAASMILHISWYIVLVLSILAFIAGVVVLFYKPVGDLISAEIAKGAHDMSSKDTKDWETFKNLPLFIKIFLVPYFGAFAVLLLKIIKKTQLLFTNFKNEIVFNNSNVRIISHISKLNIGFSIITFNFSLLLVSILLFMLCEIFKKGSALQEEHDLTV